MIRFNLEKRVDTPLYQKALVVIVAIVLSLAIGGSFLHAVGTDALEAYAVIWEQVFMDPIGWEDLLVKMSPLLLTGISVALAANMRIWNIGAEGQLYMGAFGATWVALNFDGSLNSLILLPLMVLGGMLAGAVWAGIPAVLRAYFNVNEIITTLLLNYVAISWIDYLIFGPWRDPGSLNFPLTREFSEAANMPLFGETEIHTGILYGLVLILIINFVLNKTSLGIQIKIAGDNPDAATYSGINIKRLIVYVMMASGAIAGIAGMVEVTASHHRLQQNISLGYGFTGVIVAWLAKNNPLGIIIYSFFMAVIFVGGELLQIELGLPIAMVQLFQGIILFCVLGSEIFASYKIKVLRVDS